MLDARTVCAAQKLREFLIVIYAAGSFWLLVLVLLAWGVHHLWSRTVRVKTVDAVLLPGTLLVHLGHLIALLITGGAVSGGSKRGDDKEAIPANPWPRPKIPVIGPLVVALIPMLVVASTGYLATRQLGEPVMAKMSAGRLPMELPATIAMFWEQLRAVVTLAEGTLAAFRTAESLPWKILLFAYLMTSLTVRMAPLPGNARGHLGAVLVLGLCGWVSSTVTPKVLEMIQQCWPLLTLAIGWLLLLLILSLLMRGVVCSFQVLTHNE